MWTRIVVVAVLWWTGTACTHTRLLHTQTPPAAYADSVEPLHDRTLEVRDRSGAWYQLRDTRLSRDSIVGRLAGTEASIALPLEDVNTLSHKSHSRGLLDGILLGASLGAALGLILYDGECDIVVCGREDTAMFGALGGSVWGLILGPLIGSTIQYNVVP